MSPVEMPRINCYRAENYKSCQHLDWGAGREAQAVLCESTSQVRNSLPYTLNLAAFLHASGSFADSPEKPSMRPQCVCAKSPMHSPNPIGTICRLMGSDLKSSRGSRKCRSNRGSGMAQMLLQSRDEEITSLTALPAAWTSGSVTGLCARGGFVVDIAWHDDKLSSARIFSRNGGSTQLRYGNQKMRSSDGGRNSA